MPLSRERFDQARAFIDAHARPLDRALFRHRFNAEPPDSALSELAAYQNEDGGFGHGIEPDLRQSGSSPFATSVGLQYYAALQTPDSHPMVKGAVEYLVGAYRREEGYWPPVLPDATEEPHAPWWHCESIRAPAESEWPNPNAELSGYLHCYARLVPADFLAEVADRTRANLEAISDSSEGVPDCYSLMCWLRAAPSLPPSLRDRVHRYLNDALSQAPPTPESFGEVMIHDVAPSPESLLARLWPDAVRDLLEREREKQAPDGGWWPTWEWGIFPEAWEIARQEWAGKLTAEMLFALKRYGRIEDD